SNLDAKLRVQMRVEIKKLQERLGITSIYVTHDQVEAMTLGHRLMVLNAGYVEQLGTPIELYERPATLFVAGFIGSPSMNFVDARLTDDGRGVALPDGAVLALEDQARPGEGGRAVTLGLRPEHLEQAAEGAGVAHLTVDMVEQLGADTLIHGRFGQDRTDLTVRLQGTLHMAPGSQMPFQVAPRNLHLFDPQTERRLG
ncbi:MAG: TOBE domain-containing protein, partial [Rhodobacterales bacterium]|nr:TOBE domain-containing protein [Rhodobacterales bacterium]